MASPITSFSASSTASQQEAHPQEEATLGRRLILVVSNSGDYFILFYFISLSIPKTMRRRSINSRLKGFKKLRLPWIFSKAFSIKPSGEYVHVTIGVSR